MGIHFEKPFDPAAMQARLDALPSGGIHHNEDKLRQALPSIRAARARGSSWARILACLGEDGIRTSAKRLGKLLAEAPETTAAGDAS